VETLIEAVHILKDPVPDIHLEIIGDGEYRPALEAMVERLNLQEEITFTGYVSDYTMVAPMLQRADIGVVPIWTDFQLCNKLVDYLALGIPAVTTASAAVRPYLNDDCVLYVERKNPVALADALLSLFCDPDRRASLAAAGHSAYRQHLSWEGTRDTYLNVYSGAAHQPSNLTDCARGMDFSPGLMEGTWCTQE
jgi:glycosyltransferase involved in cell wall biosynthesis